MTPIIIIFLILIIAGVIKYYLNLRSPSEHVVPEKTKTIYHYEHKNYLMTKSENDFFNVLVEAVGTNYYIFSQVHLSALVEHDVVGQNWKGALSHIDRKSVDFVICDRLSSNTILAIELDDWSHSRVDRIERDTEVERILQEARLPLLRIDHWRSLSKEEITRKVTEALPNASQNS